MLKGPASCFLILAAVVLLWAVPRDWATHAAIAGLTASVAGVGAEWLAQVLSRRWRVVLAIATSTGVAAVLVFVPINGTGRLIATTAMIATLVMLFYAAALWEIRLRMRRKSRL